MEKLFTQKWTDEVVELYFDGIEKLVHKVKVKDYHQVTEEYSKLSPIEAFLLDSLNSDGLPQDIRKAIKTWKYETLELGYKKEDKEYNILHNRDNFWHWKIVSQKN